MFCQITLGSRTGPREPVEYPGPLLERIANTTTQRTTHTYTFMHQVMY